MPRLYEGIDNEEVWVPVVGWEDTYFVSDMGRIMRVSTSGAAKAGSILKTPPNRDGYPMVTLWRFGKSRKWFVHELVLRSFVGPPPTGMETRHLDGSRSNNCIGNLKWGTDKENQYDRIEHKTTIRGEVHPNAKLSDKDVERLRSLRKTGYTFSMLSNTFGISEGHARKIVYFMIRQHKADRKER